MDHYRFAPEYYGREFHPDSSRYSMLIHAGAKLLLPELKSISKANDSHLIGHGWQTSPSFRCSLWKNFKEEFDLTTQGLAMLQKSGQKRFDEVNTAVYYLNSMVTLLGVMKTAAEDILSPFEVELSRAGRAFGRRLESLPQELLALTMSFACQEPYDLLRLSHVNRRFRHVAFSMTGMWSINLDSSMSVKLLRFCLERSRNAPLQFSFDEDDTPAQTFLTEVALHYSRWEDVDFSMRTAEDEENHDEFFLPYLTISDIVPAGAQLPQLKNLSIFQHGSLPSVAASNLTQSQAREIEYTHFYRTWKAPKLKFLFFSGIVPVPMPGASIDTLFLDLRVPQKSIDFYLALQNLHLFLRETPSLRKALLWTYTRGATTESHVREYPSVALVNLQELTLELDERPARANNDVHFSSLVNCLRIPVLSMLVVKIALALSEEPAASNITGLVNGFIPQQLGASRLADMKLYIYDPNSISREITALEFDGFPSIKTLTLGTSGLLVRRVTLHPDAIAQRSLKRIDLYGCSSKTRVSIEQFVKKVLGDHGLRELENNAMNRSHSSPTMRILEIVSEEEDLEFDSATRNDCVKYGAYWRLGYYCGCYNETGESDSDDEVEEEEEEEEEEGEEEEGF